MSKQSELVGLARTTNLDEVNAAYSAGALSNRNLVINGAMQVAQRGTIATGVGNTGYYLCDRWQYREASGVSAITDHEQSTDSPNGFKYSYKITCTTADAVAGSENAAIGYKLEGYDTAHLSYGTSEAKTLTLSFWVKSNVTGTYGIQFYNGESYTTLKSYTISSVGSWEYKTVTIDGDTANALPEGNSQGFSFVFHIATGADDITDAYDWAAQGGFRSITGQANVLSATSNYWQITGVQLEVGDTATPFEHRSYGQELALCQRYYQKIGYDGGTNVFAAGSWYGNSNAYGYMSFLQPMRAAPTLTAPTASNGYKVYTGGSTALASTLNFARASNKTARVGITTSGGTTGQGTWFELNGVSPCNVIMDAEL